MWAQALFGAGSGFGSRRAAHHRRRTARTTSSTVRSAGTPPPESPTCSSRWCAPADQQSRRQGNQLPGHRSHMRPASRFRPYGTSPAARTSRRFLRRRARSGRHRIGDENDGWRLVRTSLGHERAAGAMNQAGYYRQILNELIELAKDRGATVTRWCARSWGNSRYVFASCGIKACGRSSRSSPTANPEPAASTSRMFNTAFEQRPARLRRRSAWQLRDAGAQAIRTLYNAAGGCRDFCAPGHRRSAQAPPRSSATRSQSKC